MAGGEPGDERFEQRPVGARQRVLAARDRLHLQRRDPHDGGGAGCARSLGGRRRCRGARTVQRTSRNSATSASAAPATTVAGILAGHQPGGEVEADVGLALALLGGAAGVVEARDRPSEHGRRGGEHDQRGEVVLLLHVEAAGGRR